MNAEMMVVPHPYYAVTDESGRFEFTSVPPGTYQIVAWHEGWGLAGKEQAYDVPNRTRRAKRPSLPFKDMGKIRNGECLSAQHREFRAGE